MSYDIYSKSSRSARYCGALKLKYDLIVRAFVPNAPARFRPLSWLTFVQGVLPGSFGLDL
jgi:hypothetical protein